MVRFFTSFFISCIMLLACSPNKVSQTKVEQAVQWQIQQYPQSTLQDLYKSFFQDKFGPGHLISDTAAARRYLDSELASFTTSNNPEVEPAGCGHNFYRINLSVLKEQKIPYDIFFSAFIESANAVQQPSIADWKKEWRQIENYINKMNLQLANYENDKVKIDSLLIAGKYAVHHSDVYGQAYQPHYRIINKFVYERDLKKYIR